MPDPTTPEGRAELRSHAEDGNAIYPSEALALLDALDQAEQRIDTMAGQARDVWLLAEKQEKEKKFWVKIANSLALEKEKSHGALDRVRKLCQSTDGEWLAADFDGNTVGDIRRALDGDS